MGRRSQPRDYQVLLKHRQYFGIEPQRLRAAAARVVSRVVGLPPERAHVTDRQLHQDFGVGTALGRPVVESLVAEGLLQPYTDAPGIYRVAPRLVDIAAAKVIDPLPRERARQLVVDACALARRINAEWSRVPLEIEALATYGSYMSRDAQLADLSFGVVVRARPATRRAHWRTVTKAEGASGIRGAFRALDPFVRARLVTELVSLPRPFAVVYKIE